MIDLLDLPKYLSEHNNKVDDVKILCLLDRQIEMPSHLKPYSDSSNMAALVDVIGIDISGRKYLMKGKSVVILGPRAFEPVDSGRKVLLLTGNAVLRDNNYVEVSLIYPMKTGGFSLYATKTLYRDIPSMRNAYPDLMKHLDRIAQLAWNLDVFYSNFDFPYNYRVACEGCEFSELSEKDKFVYKSDEEYRRSLIVNKPLNNNSIQKTNEKATKVDRSHIEQRNGILPLPDLFYSFDSLINKAEDRVNQKIKQLDMIPKKRDIENAISYTYNQLKSYWKYSPNANAVTGRAIMKNVLEHIFNDYKGKYVGSKLLIDDALDNKNVLDIWYSGEVPESLEKVPFYKDVVYKREEIYIGFIDYLLGLRQKLVNAYSYGMSLEIDMFSVICYNPYYLSLIDNRLNVEDLDKLSLLYKVDLKESEVQKFRNVAYLHNFLLNPDNDKIEDNTMILKNYVLRNISNGYILSSACYKSLQTNETILTDKILNNLRFYIIKDMDFERFYLNPNGWSEYKIKGVLKYTRPINRSVSNEEVIRDYISSGMGIEISFDNEVYLMDYSHAYKERFIIRKLYSLYEEGEKPYLNPDNIEACIRGFEKQKALDWNMPSFKLEEKQADAVRMLYNPVMCLTGPAGSGKTTTAEAILYGLQALLGIEEDGIMFCAPTGKAAQRLKEIVKKPTQTIHSLFTIGGESFNILGDSDTNKKYEIKVLIVDESSMINLELMYNMMSKIAKKTRIIFMGDIEQLPPIGAGKPFYNILGFLPSVVLDVTKRSSANSGITKNAEEIIYNSEMITNELQQYDDFRILDVPKDKIVKLVTGIVNYHLGGAGEKRTGDTVAASRVLQSLDVDLKPDDIQVISPVRKKYDWGTDNLNSVLQDVFNSRKFNDTVLRTFLNFEIDSFSGEKKPVFCEYRIGDRVIHIENNYNMLCFHHKSGSTFQLLSDKQGVMNGDVGKILGFYLGSDLVFVDEYGDEDKATRDSFANDSKIVYLAVNYEGINSKGQEITYTVLYRGEIIDIPEFNSLSIKDKCYIVESSDLKKLELAYALTVHKIQGSQAKLIICVMYPIRYSDFISRNMIYTSITRAVEGIYLVGNVLGYGNVINKGRKIEQTSQRLTAMDKIFLGGV